MNRQQIEQQLLARAREDAGFRQALLADPRAAIQQEAGISIPPGVELEVVEETPQRLCLVLPQAEGELSDLELEGVAGGKGEPAAQSPGGGGWNINKMANDAMNKITREDLGR